MDADTGKFYFIEVNPRIQVEHTVTEEVTGIDIVKAQIHILEGVAIGTPESGVPAQEDIRLNGHALQCRITTEDPEQNFIPDYGRITAYRGATGFGIRLDGGTAYSGAVITRFYDPLLEKVTAWAPTPAEAIARMHRALREFRIRGVATNLTFLEAIISHPTFRDNAYTTRFIDTTPELFAAGQAPGPRDQAAQLSRRRHRQRPSRDARPAAAAGRCGRAAWCRCLDGHDPDGHQAAARRAGAGEVRRLDARRRSACWSPTPRCATATSRCSRPACAPTTSPRIAGAYARALPQLLSLECWGGATFDVAMRFLTEDPWERLAADPRGGAEPPAADAAARRQRRRLHQLSRQCRAASSSRQAAAGGIDLFRVFDCLNWVENMRVAMDAVRRGGQALRGGDLLHRRHPRSGAAEIRPQILCRRWPSELEAAGAHIIGVKDMAGLLKPAAAASAVQGAARGDRPADPFPHPRHVGHLGGDGAGGGRSRRRRRRRGDGCALRQHLAALPRLDRRGAEGHRARSRPRPAMRSATSRSTGRRCAPSTPPSKATSRGRPRRSICTRCRAGSSPISRSRRARSGWRRAGTRWRRPMPTSTRCSATSSR